MVTCMVTGLRGRLRVGPDQVFAADALGYFGADAVGGRLAALWTVSRFAGLSVAAMSAGMHIRSDGWILPALLPDVSGQLLVVYQHGRFLGGWGVGVAFWHADHDQFTLPAAGGVPRVCLWRPLPALPALPSPLPGAH